VRRAAKVDANQAQVVAALRAVACEVECLHAVGGGVADLLVYRRPTQRLFLIEVKDGSKPPSERRLTPAQEGWHRRFPVSVATSVEDALRIVGALAS